MANYTICAYMRLSQEDSDVFGRKIESGSITSQRRLIMEFINNQPEFAGCNVIERCDDGISGRYFDTRPQFTEMIELAKKGKINCIIVKDCSRFGRDYVELGDYLEQLFPFLGVRFIAINDHYDSDKTEGGLDIAFKNLVYDIYSRDLSRKVKNARRQMALQGKYVAGQTLYGYRKSKKDKHKLELDPVAGPIVREIFDMKLSGMKLTDIARNLNDRGISCPTLHQIENGEAVNHNDGYEYMCWTCGAVNQVLGNEEYTGAVIALKTCVDRVTGKSKPKPKEEWVYMEGMHEAIVTKDEFQRVQKMIKPKKKACKKRKLYYRCSTCGSYLIRRNRYREAGADLYCNKGYFLDESCGCRSISIKEKMLDGIVLSELKKKLARVLDEEELRLDKKDDSEFKAENIKSFEMALDSVKKAKQMLFEKLADRSIDRETFKEKKVQYDVEIAELEQKISDASLAESISQESDGRLDEIKSFLDIETMNDDIWQKFIKDVIVYPGGRIEIQWNFEEEF